jgi:hypothetical protein
MVMKYNKFVLLLIFSLYLTLFGFAQPPANDNCPAAIILTPSAQYFCDYTFIQGTTLDATDSGLSTTCGADGDDDVWYKFAATHETHYLYIGNASGTDPDIVIAAYTGICGSLDSLTCANNNGLYSGEELTLSGLTIGDTIFLRIFDGSIGASDLVFDICLYSPPSNDICSEAYEIVPELDNSICAPWVSTAAATDQNIGVGDCGIDISYDIWYKFTAISNRHIVSFFTAGDMWLNGQFIVEVWDGCSGPELECMAVNYDGGYDEIEFNSLIIGNDYYIRLYGSETSQASVGELCVNTPANETEDDCQTAEILTVGGQNSCFASYNNSLGGATESSAPLDACSPGPYLDLWYKFAAINSAAVIKTTVNSSGNIAIAAFTGSSCNSLTLISCVNDTGNGEDELLYLSGLTIGDTIYVRVYDVDVNNTPINFDICVYTPPANDFCANATIINTTNGANCLGNIAGSTHGASGSGGCAGGTADDDVWYRFTATDTLHLIHLYNVNISMPIIEIFNNDCSGSQFGCIQGTQFVSTDFILGQQYYLRIYSQEDQNGQGSFNICISEPPVSIFCENAIGLSVNSGLECTTTFTGNSEGQGTSLMKYTFEATSTTQIIYITPISPMTFIVNNQKILDENCSLIDNLGSNIYSGVQRSYFKNFSIGQDYKFEVRNGNPVEGNYQICITEAVDNDECVNALVIPSSSINFNCGCDILINGSCIAATPSDVSPSMGHDVWYSFLATSNTMTFSLNTANGSTSVSGRVYGDCNTSLGFIGFTGLTLNNLTIGLEYKIRIVALNSNGSPGDFTLCIKSLSNDFCASPLTLTPNSGLTCSNPISSSTIGATASNPSYCSSSNRKDVWFQFTAIATTHIVKVNPTTPGFYPDIHVYRKSSSTANCDLNCIQSSISCLNSPDAIDFMPNIALLTSLTIGVTYLIAVSNLQVNSPSGDFNICVLTPGNNMNVWSTQVETYSTTAVANAGRYEFPTKRIKLNMTGTTSPSTVTQIVVNTSGTTSTADLLSAKLYYAGAVNGTSPQGSMSTYNSVKDAGEIDAVLFAAAVVNPNGQLIFNGTRNIVGQSGEYNRYFFLVYDIACDATIGNQVNAELESITISSVTHIPFEAVNTPNNIETQNRIFTKADGFWSDPNTWICGVPPNGPDILPITMNHTVTVDDNRQCGNISLSYLKGLSISASGVLTMGQSSQGAQTGHSNKFLNAQWGLLSVYGTLNVNGGLRVGEYSSNGSNHFGQLAIEGTVNIDGNDGTALGSAYSGIIIGTPSLSGSGFINILDPSYNNTGTEFLYDSRYNINRNVNWTVTFGGGDDNSIFNGFDVDMIDIGSGSGFSTLRVKDIYINGGLLNEKREVNVQATLLPCQNMYIGQGAEIIGSVGFSGDFINNGYYTSAVFANIQGTLICANNFSWNTFASNTVNQNIAGSGFFRAYTSLPYPTSHNENSINNLLVQTTANVFLSNPITVREKLMIKSGTIITTDTSLLTLGTEASSSGQLCQTNSSNLNYSATEFEGTFESWTGGGVQGPFRRYFHNNTTLDYKGFMPLRQGANIRSIGFKLKNNALNGSITASFNSLDYGSRCLPLLNEQGIDISNVSPSGYWKFISDNLMGEYDISINANGFNKRGGGTITDLTNVRTLISPNIPTYIHSESTNLAGPTLLSKVMLQNISFHQDTFVLCLGGGANAAGPPLSASTYIVNSINDFGPGSFRDAMISIFCNDTIRFDHILDNDTILLTSILPPVNKNVIVIMEPNQNIVIKNQTNDVIFDIPPHYELELINTNILGNHTSSNLIYNQGLLILDNSTISNANIPNTQPLLLNDGSGEIIIKNVSVIKE